MRFAVIVVLLGVAACARTIAATPDEIAVRVMPTVGTQNFGDDGRALKVAEEHCDKFGKKAVLDRQEVRVNVYRCE